MTVVINVPPGDGIGIAHAELCLTGERSVAVVDIQHVLPAVPVADGQIQVAVVIGVAKRHAGRVAHAEIRSLSEVPVSLVDVHVVLLLSSKSAISGRHIGVAVVVDVAPNE